MDTPMKPIAMGMATIRESVRNHASAEMLAHGGFRTRAYTNLKADGLALNNSIS